jgi:hypothetical protein
MGKVGREVQRAEGSVQYAAAERLKGGGEVAAAADGVLGV